MTIAKRILKINKVFERVGNLDIYYSTFEDNVVTDRGGAVLSYSYVGIYDSTFIRNKGTGTSSTGGSIYINGNSNNILF